MANNPLFCAIDTPNIEQASSLIHQISPHVGGIKLGLEFFVANGIEGTKKTLYNNNLPLFLDLKFHDIPNTVAGAIHSTSSLNVHMMTVHCSGGKAMLEAARDAAENVATQTGKRPLIIGVSMLTSLDDDDARSLGYESTIADQVLRFAELAQKSGIDGLVCSPHEIAAIRERFGNTLHLVVPGIRPEGSAQGDQKRVMTPKQALAAGANTLVIGRPITQSDDPANAAKSVWENIK